MHDKKISIKYNFEGSILMFFISNLDFNRFTNGEVTHYTLAE